jgi:hypothetical protein
LIKFLISLVFATGAILVVGHWGLDMLPGYFYQTLIFLFVSTAGLYRFLLKTKQQRPEFFVQFYLATMAVKLIAYGAYVFLVVRKQPDEATANVAFFMIVYFIFTFIEIGFLYREVNR